MHSASKQHKTSSFWSWCSKTPPQLQHAFRHLNQLPWSFLCRGDGWAHTWTMPSLITFFALIPSHIPTSCLQPFSLPPPGPSSVSAWWLVGEWCAPSLSGHWRAVGCPVSHTGSWQSHLPAHSKTSDSHWTEQSVGTASEIHFLLCKDLGWRKYNDSRWL